MNSILLTGGNGFVGQALLRQLAPQGLKLRVALRQTALPEVDSVVVGNIGTATDWSDALRNIDCVVHLAARVHQIQDKAPDPLGLYRAVNTAGSARLAQQAQQAGVRRFVYVSTAKVYGEISTRGPFSESHAPNPRDAYAISKWEAEQVLGEIAGHGNMALTILRPPLVYGPGVGANFLRLVDYVAVGRRLPLAAVRNCRSLIGLTNLANAIALCMAHPGAGGKCFNVSDNEDLSTPELIRRLARALDVAPHLMPMPEKLLRLGARIAGYGPEADRLLGDFAVDSSCIRETLGWKPRSVDEELHDLAHWYRRLRARTEHETGHR